ncbi:FliO/MopB family protein [Sphingomonas lenta]|uniref:Flagellar biosynthetic protein FliO n=1 Tax=Sphingomonas lenta TaxID=1141887 RepID=A0A2A2SCR2_9SPHN|nr:flagellar biosynthetic protein FliO [Sphingomonas lenta]PAX06980.1 flagellar biosynthetic protein FliO [Sphingomonas lenta]
MDSTLGAAFSGLLGTLIALAFVLGLAYLSLKFLRRWQDRFAGPPDGGPQRRLRFVRALPVGQRERLILVEAEGELMLIGVSAGSVTLLRNWGPAPDGDADDATTDARA